MPRAGVSGENALIPTKGDQWLGGELSGRCCALDIPAFPPLRAYSDDGGKRAIIGYRVECLIMHNDAI